jgi:hypothetical protein
VPPLSSSAPISRETSVASSMTGTGRGSSDDLPPYGDGDVDGEAEAEADTEAFEAEAEESRSMAGGSSIANDTPRSTATLPPLPIPHHRAATPRNAAGAVVPSLRLRIRAARVSSVSGTVQATPTRAAALYAAGNSNGNGAAEVEPSFADLMLNTPLANARDSRRR